MISITVLIVTTCRQLFGQGGVLLLFIAQHPPGAAPKHVGPVVGRDLLGHQPVEDLRVARGERVAEEAEVDGDEGLAEENVEVGRLVVLLAVEEGAQRGHARPLARLRHDGRRGRRRRRVHRRLTAAAAAGGGSGDEGGVLVQHREAGERIHNGVGGTANLLLPELLLQDF